MSTLSPAKPALWLRLKHYHFDHLVPAHLTDRVMAVFGGADAATRAFASKIARKHNWTPAFALRAIGEYRKFLYLGMVSETPVTPSRIIDTVWHEHLLFTRGYDDFCREVLGRPFEHHPELMGMDEQTEVFASQYGATLDLYEAEFDREPPADIWSTPKFRPGLARVKRVPRKQGSDGDGSSSSGSDTPLYTYFAEGGASAGGDVSEFGGGGGFSGAGGESSWGDSHGHGGDSGSGGHGGHSGSDSSSDGSADGGSSDGGGSDGGGSGCSSGCGGGGCGGGGD